MKNTGIVRKIDELGRIVIPKEIRNRLNILSYDDIEIFVEENKIILSKYSKILDLKTKSDKYINLLKEITDNMIFITDKQKVISFGKLENKKISDIFISCINEVKEYKSNDLLNMPFDDICVKGYVFVVPIMIDGCCSGLIGFIKNKTYNETDELLIRLLKKLIEN